MVAATPGCTNVRFASSEVAMFIRLIAILLCIPLLLGASSSSNSAFVFEFNSSSASSDSLVRTAINSLEKFGFHRVESCCAATGVELQYGNRPVFAYVASPAHGLLQISLAEIRGGCSSIPEVAGVKDAIAHVRSDLESQFGSASVSEYHAANQSPRPITAVEKDASQVVMPLAPRTAP